MEKLKFIDEGLKPLLEKEETDKLCSYLHKKYSAFLVSEHFLIESGYNTERVQIKYTLEKLDGTICYPIECVYLRDPESEITPAQAASVLLDYLDVYFNDYLNEERSVYIPLGWSKHSLEGLDFYLRGFVRNMALEKAADELLKTHGFGDYDIEPISSET